MKRSSLAKIVPVVVLPEGYSGKIMLLSIVAGKESLLVLRSGGRWHRDILRNAEAEIRDLGLFDARIDELGGAHLRCEADGSIFIWGRSDEFGSCDHRQAAALLKSLWPGRKVAGIFGEMA
ncbi:MAG: hypothetical protein M0009_03665 [Deltaproteobacteria bacterium]|nr:hypothetical protein [Deltaproteobacteria bacterium]